MDRRSQPWIAHLKTHGFERKNHGFPFFEIPIHGLQPVVTWTDPRGKCLSARGVTPAHSRALAFALAEHLRAVSYCQGTSVSAPPGTE